MTPTPDRPTFWTPTNVMGFFLAACGVALGAWSKATATLTTPTLIAVGLLVGAGMWFVNSPLASGFAHEASEIVPSILAARRGQMTVAQPADTSVVVEREQAADVVVPPQADPVVMRDRPERMDRLAYNTAETIRLTALPDPATPRRRRRKTDDAPSLAAPQEHPPYVPPPVQTPVGDDEGIL